MEVIGNILNKALFKSVGCFCFKNSQQKKSHKGEIKKRLLAF